MKALLSRACVAVLLSSLPAALLAEELAPHPIDLPIALRLAGARNLDIQIARERVRRPPKRKRRNCYSPRQCEPA